MEYVIAFIALVYILIRFAFEKFIGYANRLEWEEKKRVTKQAHDNFVNKHTDLALEARVRADTELRKSTSDFIRTNFGYWKPSAELIDMVAMAPYGKIPSNIIEKRICTPCNSGVINLNKLREFMVYYNGVLRQHGVDEDIFFIGDYYVDGTMVLSISQPFDKPYRGGFWWKSIQQQNYICPDRVIIFS